MYYSVNYGKYSLVNCARSESFFFSAVSSPGGAAVPTAEIAKLPELQGLISISVGFQWDKY